MAVRTRHRGGRARPRRAPAGRRAAPATPEIVEAHVESGATFRRFEPVEMAFTLNGAPTAVRFDPSRTLLELLRYDCGLTGTKEGCSKGECGACTVLMDGKPVNSCLVMARQAEGAEVVTIEGLAACRGKGEGLHPVQRGFIERGGAQCGICTPGFIMAAAALLERNPSPTDDELVKGLEGNLCRCTGYLKIFESVRRAAEILREG